MRDWLVLIAHLIITTIRTIAPGGARAVIAESLLLKHQLLILNRSRKKAPRLRALDRILLGLGAILVSPRRILKVAVAIRPATLLRFHRALVRRKYQWLFSAKTGRRPGPKGPSKELIAAVLEIKRLNPRFGCPRIAQQISHAFGLEIDKDVVRRILANHHFPKPGGEGPSWLSIIAEARDSLWSADLFRCESVLLKSFWVMLVMDVFTRRIVGFGVEPAHIDGISVCRMFNQARRGQPLPKRLSSDHDPLFRFHRWRANLRILDIEEIKSVPFVPRSHPFIERLIGTFGASISTRPSSGTASTSIGSWIDSPPITTSGVSTPDWVDGRPSSDAARLCANRRIYMTSPGNPTVPVSSTRQLLRDQQFAIVRPSTRGFNASVLRNTLCHRLLYASAAS